MSFGKMNTQIDIIREVSTKDAEGFTTASDIILASVRAYKEGRHGSVKWANRAAFTEATDLFIFRCIPDVVIKTGMIIACDTGRYEITSIEDVKNRDMYIEVLAKEVKPIG